VEYCILSFDDDYSSEAFENFKKNRVAVAWRLAEQRNDARLTSSPDYDINQIIIDPETGEAYPNGYGPTSQEVMIPAFLSAMEEDLRIRLIWQLFQNSLCPIGG
jgi:cell surface protein SprA